ncbi:hypothetical protein EZS27_041350 [termite gut metagenome]|uniref:Uncharacterized protein n=1 Tax=termite gut metagenome TaxID=433724 RepID=A0A5J4PBY1_9ZZZZ
MGKALRCSQGRTQSYEFGKGAQDIEGTGNRGAIGVRFLYIKDIKGKIEVKVGREVSDDYVWDFMEFPIKIGVVM